MFGHPAFACYWIGRIVSILSISACLGLRSFVPMMALLVSHVAETAMAIAILLVCQSGEAWAACFLTAGTLMEWLDPRAIYVIRFPLLQHRAPAVLRGRVSAVWACSTGTSNYIGDFRAGAVAALVGAPLAAILGAAGVFAMLALWLFLFPQ